MAKSGSLDFVARDWRLDSRQRNSGNGRLFSASVAYTDTGGLLRTIGKVDRNRGYCGKLALWHCVGGAGQDLWVFSGPETAFSIDMDRVRLPPNKLITYSTVPGPSASPRQNALPRTLSKGNKNAREKNSIQLWQNIRYNPSPPFNNPQTCPLFPSIMSDSPPDDTYDDHKLPDEPGEGAQLAGNLETGRSPFLSPFAIPLRRSITRVLSYSLCSQSPCFSFRPRCYTSETRSWSSQGQQEQDSEERCGHSRVHVRSCSSGWREEEKGETS